MRRKEHSPVYQAMMNTFAQNDPHSFAVKKALDDIYPAFGKKIFENNDFMFRLVMSGMNPMDILEYPICGRCETLAAWHTPVLRGGKYVATCYCLKESCHHTTVNPITLKTWMRDELRKKGPKDWADMAEYLVDTMAAGFVRKATGELYQLMNVVNAPRNQQMGIVDSDGNLIEAEDRAHIEVNQGDAPLDIDKYAKEIEEDMDNV